MTYAAIGEGRTQHNAAMQVITLGSEHSRLAWITDLVTKQVAAVSDELMKRRASTMQQTLQTQATHSELEAANGYGQRAKQHKERGTICQHYGLLFWVREHSEARYRGALAWR